MARDLVAQHFPIQSFKAGVVRRRLRQGPVLVFGGDTIGPQDASDDDGHRQRLAGLRGSRFDPLGRLTDQRAQQKAVHLIAGFSLNRQSRIHHTERRWRLPG